MVAPLKKLLPVMVRVNAPSPAVLLAGERLLIVGTGLLTVKVNALEAAVPELLTDTEILPGLAISLALIEALT